mmetsp:Transcript_30798/g.40930  ORF Transcript_30798/g.40930 Transcript_30798/m.40930 type:complete len:107 (-) Transcript_30798:53-373(-)|eukprot:CAMPEP_0185574796 /NCGR_PEP_ID=MMETSP0434-20130131/6160_1 /TAXON_ID=626734 ORGANISM="Favella taraikaensis, Strain Fe Narragansett Bay" /NCGR_SAMPLE_ID=MMETSP0434 /ASSEMBLY_ACC=CAM_ASM_000379 /LENGTH=106 /DNA_ID=CAMNT_0028191473 /DNA_START=1794 /DNA_END=2117 /DNA_ORIENTATION=+
MPLASLKKKVSPALHFLDIEKLPSKTQTILSKFEMIVIAKIVNVEEQVPLDESLNVSEIDLAFDRQDPEESKQGQKPQTYLCEAIVEQLVAFSDLQFTVYNHIYAN